MQHWVSWYCGGDLGLGAEPPCPSSTLPTHAKGKHHRLREEGIAGVAQPAWRLSSEGIWEQARVRGHSTAKCGQEANPPGSLRLTRVWGVTRGYTGDRPEAQSC